MRWALTIAACLATSAVARADGLSTSDLQRLEDGGSVILPQTYDRTMYESNRRFIGGLAYSVVDATPEELLALLDDTTKWPALLPKVKDARVIKRDGKDEWVEVTQAHGILRAVTTLHLQRDREGVRFWLEPSRPHAIDDAWGFFRVSPLLPKDGAPRALLTFGVLVDTGPGLIRSFYEERFRAAMLNVPSVVRQYVIAARALSSERRFAAR